MRAIIRTLVITMLFVASAQAQPGNGNGNGNGWGPGGPGGPGSGGVCTNPACSSANPPPYCSNCIPIDTHEWILIIGGSMLAMYSLRRLKRTT